ncbi:MAG TPA: polyphosphate kinase 1 [Burkholderiaceae bacterium]|nr:polyphosphate kinase 1 [Burkholderiaceae bacterium]
MVKRHRKPKHSNKRSKPKELVASPNLYLNRDLSLLAFNERVLEMAARTSVPLAERLRYVCIVSSNLDEFFEVRVSDLTEGAGPSALVYGTVLERAHRLVAQQYALYNDTIMPELAKQNIVIVNHAQRTPEQRAWLRDYVHREVKPLLAPIGLDPSHPFPQVLNKSLNFIMQLEGKDAFGRPSAIAILKVPRVLPRVIPVPVKLAPGKQAFVLLTSAIRAHLQDLFPGREISGFSQFRVTRDSDLTVDEREVHNLRQAMRMELTQRHFGNAVRLEILRTCPLPLQQLLQEQFQIPSEAVFQVDGPVNLVRLNQLVDLLTYPKLRWPPFAPAWPRKVSQSSDMFGAMKQGDILLHHPFESFEPVIEFLRQSAVDPRVAAIRMTLYRTGISSVMVDILEEAARRGKEVTAIVELKARFDEEANINLAERLEAVGAQVVYGVLGLKTHGKMTLVLRREEVRNRPTLVRYAHLGTGNYHAATTKLYTDFGMLTAHAEICADIEKAFLHMTSLTKVERLKHLWMAPFTLHRNLLRALANEVKHARSGKPARIIAKMNALTDEATINALYSASKAGVKIDLIVRGACALRPGVKGLSDNIRVRSIVGRFLEHHRIYYFLSGGTPKVYLSSADWMGRNLFRRIEIAWPVLDSKLRKRVVDEGLEPYLDNAQDAWILQPDGEYRAPKLGVGGRSAQSELLAKLAASAGET